jgi:hypothetical protein
MSLIEGSDEHIAQQAHESIRDAARAAMSKVAADNAAGQGYDTRDPLDAPEQWDHTVQHLGKVEAVKVVWKAVKSDGSAGSPYVELQVRNTPTEQVAHSGAVRHRYYLSVNAVSYTVEWLSALAPDVVLDFLDESGAGLKSLVGREVVFSTSPDRVPKYPNIRRISPYTGQELRTVKI